jgi:AcrR family transcriptional regulator
LSIKKYGEKMPRTKEQNKELKLNRKKMIADSGLKVFCVKGFEGTQMTDIAKEAAISHGLIYHYFESKQDIYNYIMENFTKSITEKINAVTNAENNNRKKLEAITEFFINNALADKSYPFLFFTMISKRFQEINIQGIFDKKPKKKGLFDIIHNIFFQGLEKGELSFDGSASQAVLLYLSIIHGANLGVILCPVEYRNKIEFLTVNSILSAFTK